MVVGARSLGCGNSYKFYMTTSCGVDPIEVFENVEDGRFNRVLDDISELELTIAFTPQCSNLLEKLVLGRHYISVIRNGVVEWKGPILRVEFNSPSITFSASDPLWWASKRVIEESAQPVHYNSPLELFETMVLGEINKSDGGCSTTFTPACFRKILKKEGGSSGSWVVEKPGVTSVDALLEDFADSFLDYTVVGDELYYGFENTPIPDERFQAPPVLNELDWSSPPKVVRDIQNVANKAFVNIDDKRFVGSRCSPQHGLLETIVDRKNLSSDETGIEAVETFLDENARALSSVENNSSSELAPTVAWDMPRMIPGMLVYTKTSSYGLQIDGAYRLHEMVCNFSPSGEKIKVSLEPVK